MAYMNKVILIGNLTRDPELTFTPGGAAICKFGIAMNRRFSQNGQDKEETCFVDIVIWGKQAESSARFLQKGASVLIEGRLTYEQWTDKESQKKRSQIRVTAERVQFMSRREDFEGGDDSDDNSGAPPQSYQRQQSPRQQHGAPNQSRQQYAPNQPRQQRPAYDNAAPQMPPQEEYPFEDVEGVDDDIPF